MSPLAHADIPVARTSLRDPETRFRIRGELFNMLLRLGEVRTIRYVRDPLDGPLFEQGYPTDDMAVVRAIAEVRPR